MNKKFLSAILFGALMVSSTGTFVSCKDYDDDIDNLQGQIDKLATKEDMEAKLAQMQAAIDAAKATAEEALKKAEAGGNADEIADLTKRIEALEKATIDVEALKKELKDAVNEDIDKFRGEMEELIGEVEGLVGKIADLVTSVELVKSYAIDQESGFAPIMLSTAIEQENVFSEGISNKITFTKDAEVQTPGQFLVRVSPTNAVLTPDMISLVNSQGENLDGILEVVKVEKSEVLLSRAANESGLWNVTVQLKNYGDGKAFDAATSNEGKKILFAAQVNNTLSTSETRYVTSSYDLTLGWKEFEGANKLNYFVDTKNVAEINNRFSNTSLSLKEQTATIDYKELEWKDKAAVKPTADNTENADDRSDKEVYPAVQGQALKIALSSSNDKVVAPTNIRAIYVVLDKQNAVESAPSELNAWNSYTYTGLNTVVEGTSTEITIDSKSAINDIIGFRVFAVNYDGTLVDPDGKAFYVNLGDASKDWNAAATKITALDPTNVTTAQSALIPVTLTKVNAAKATWATDKIGDNTHIFDAYFVDAEDNVLFSTANLTNMPADFSKVAKVYTKPTINNWTSYEDDKAYNGTLTLTAATGHVVASMNVSMTKEVPNTLPEGFSLRDKQVINGVYNCYMIADNWTAEAATSGKMPVANFINFGKGDAAKYEVKLADSQYNADNNKLEAQTVTGDASISVDAEFVNNKTPHATVVSYNYGLVSSKKDADGKFIPVKIKATDFNTVYCCFYKKEIHTWDWATRAQLGGDYNILKDPSNPALGYKKDPLSTTLTYGNPVDESGNAIPTEAYNNFIFGQNAIDGTFSKLLSAPYEGSLVVKSAKLVSDATQKEDYFSVSTPDLKFTAIKTDLGSNPKENVPSTLTVTCVDSYGHEVVISLKMTVAPRK
jgi:hypothetical protein